MEGVRTIGYFLGENHLPSGGPQRMLCYCIQPLYDLEGDILTRMPPTTMHYKDRVLRERSIKPRIPRCIMCAAPHAHGALACGR